VDFQVQTRYQICRWFSGHETQDMRHLAIMRPGLSQFWKRLVVLAENLSSCLFCVFAYKNGCESVFCAACFLTIQFELRCRPAITHPTNILQCFQLNRPSTSWISHFNAVKHINLNKGSWYNENNARKTFQMHLLRKPLGDHALHFN
jgi:hypothetical protein